MSWIIFATISYFLGALTVIFDKFLLSSQKISSPPVYAFYVGLTGLGVLIFAPIGFFYEPFSLHIPAITQVLLSFFSGIFLMAGYLAMYFAIKKAEASKVTPIVFSLVPLVTFTLSLFVGSENFTRANLLGMAALVFGGLLISFDLPLKLKKKKFFAGFYLALLAGFLLGISLLTLKFVYFEQNFFNGYVWTRTGAFLGACLMLFVPTWRKMVLKSLKAAKHNKKENAKTGGLFIFNKILGGSSSALYNLAIGLGSVTLVSSMISLQYAFVLIIAVLAGRRLPHIFEERMYFWDWAQKVAAIFIIAIGIFFIS